MTTENRDVVCAAAVGRMAALGRFDKELTVYGCAYMEDGSVRYRLSTNALQIHRFAAHAASAGIYPTSVRSFSKRTPVPAGMEEHLLYESKLELARELQKNYPRIYFETLTALGEAPANNASVPLLRELAQAIEGHYDDAELQLFAQLLEHCFQGKLIDRYGHYRFNDWLSKVRRQMEDDPVPGAQLKRTLYGFSYKEDDRIRTSYDAVEATVCAEREAQHLQGKICGPIIHRTYWLENFGEMAAARRDFKALLLEKEGEAMFAFIERIAELPSAVDEKIFADTLRELEAQGAELAAVDFRRYGRLWNVCEKNS